jgi:hypothetical protein
MKKYNEDIEQLLKTVYDSCSEEDQAVRERQLREWRRFKLLWEGFNQIWFSSVAHDWRVWDETEVQDNDQAYYDKPMNVFKAYLESIIAALSVTVPPVKCFPDDATNTLDIATARAGDKIGQLVYRHNNVPLLWLHALFIYCTEGMVACRNYSHESKDYGFYTEHQYEDVEEEHKLTTCSSCGYTINDEALGTSAAESIDADSLNQNPEQMPEGQNDPKAWNQAKNQEIDEFDPGLEDIDLHSQIFAGKELCPSCMAIMDPSISTEKFVTSRIVGSKTFPKSRIHLEAFGGLYVKVPNYARNQAKCPYLIFSREEDYSMVIEEYNHLYGNKKLKRELKVTPGETPGGYEEYAQWARLSPQYRGEYPLNVVTVNDAWIRPSRFNCLPNEEDVKKLKNLFPDGVRITVVNDVFAAACPEPLDDHWTLLENPLSDYVHFEPLGQSLTSVQDITNDLISLILQTIEHGIGQTFVDPAVVDLDAYEQTETVPGGIYPTKPQPSGSDIRSKFFEVRTATLSQEVMPFYQQVQSTGQLTSGALPSLFGGQIVGSETASVYSMSREQARQRQNNAWKMFTIWWKKIFSKVVPMYIDNVKEDERDVQTDNDGNFINVVIRKAELEGKIGKIELEANENLPLTWHQRQAIIEKLFNNPNPEIMKVLSAPENAPLIYEYLGLSDFYVPGEDDVIQQYDEIRLLLDSEPIADEVIDPMTGQPVEDMVPSVEIDPINDNHEVGFRICRKWIISEEGRQAKQDNSGGYMNVLLHGKLHFMELQRMQAEAAMAEQAQGAAPPKKPKETDQEAPIMGESNVETLQ